MKTSLADMWLYSVSAVLADPHVLPPVAIGALHQVGLRQGARCSASESCACGPGTHPWMKMPNSMCAPSPNSASGPATVCLTRALAGPLLDHRGVLGGAQVVNQTGQQPGQRRPVPGRPRGEDTLHVGADHLADATPRSRLAGVTRTTVTRPSSVLGSRCTKPSSSSWRTWRPQGRIQPVRRASSPSDSGPSSWMRAAA